jgi:plasmid stabilization system protein ParE
LDIWSYVAPHASEAVADRIYDRIEEHCQLLKEHPQIGPARPEIAENARERWLSNAGGAVPLGRRWRSGRSYRRRFARPHEN